MKSFHTVAIPHADILEGKLTMYIFAADLWETYSGRGPGEYKDSDIFFQKGNVLECEMHLFDLVRGEYMSVMKRKKKNTQLEQQKKAQREKDLKKKQMRQQLPPKGKK